MKKYSFVLMLSLSLSQTLNAANFTIKEGETVNTQQVLPEEGDKGTIEKGGTLATGATTAVLMQNGNQKLKNSGEISTNGFGAIGISSTDADVKINNRGKILTTGGVSDGIDSTGANAKIKNSGVISVNGSLSYGIDNFGTNAKIKNSGEIFTNGFGSIGILSNGVNAKTKNSGEISTSGMSAFGIASNGANARVENSGRVTTSGDSAHGIQIFRENSEVKNSGEISTTGALADGIYSFGVNAHITNSGIIKSEQGFALNFVNINPTLTLKRGSNIQGRVNNPQPMNLYVKKGLNLDLTTEGAGFDAIGIDDPYVIDGVNVVVVDRSGFVLQADFFGRFI